MSLRRRPQLDAHDIEKKGGDACIAEFSTDLFAKAASGGDQRQGCESEYCDLELSHNPFDCQRGTSRRKISGLTKREHYLVKGLVNLEVHRFAEPTRFRVTGERGFRLKIARQESALEEDRAPEKGLAFFRGSTTATTSH